MGARRKLPRPSVEDLGTKDTSYHFYASLRELLIKSASNYLLPIEGVLSSSTLIALQLKIIKKLQNAND